MSMFSRSEGATWEGAMQRERRLHFIQLAVLVIALVATGIAAALAGRQIATADDRRVKEEDHLASLVSLRERARVSEVQFWAGRAAGDAGQSAIRLVAVRAFPALLRGLAANDPSVSAAERTALGSSLAALDALRPYAQAALPPLGSAEDLRNIRAVAPARAQLRNAINDLTSLQEADARAAWAEARSAIKNAVIVLISLLGAIGVGVILAWFLVERERRRLVRAIAAGVEEQNALMDSLQSGLFAVGSGGRLEEVNDRLCKIVGFDAEDLLGTVPPRPFWPAAAEEELRDLEARMRSGESGECDAVFQTTAGDLVPVTLAFSPIGDKGGYVVSVLDETERRRADDELRRAVRQQAALGRVATAVAAFDGESAEPVFAIVAEEVCRLLGSHGARVARFEESEAVIVGAWTDPTLGIESGPMFARLPLDAGTALGEVHRTGRVARIDDYSLLTSVEGRRIAERFRGAVAAPVRVGGRLWGAMSAVTTGDMALESDAEEDLSRFADLVGIAVSNAEARARLVDEASTDTLTGLGNHRVFHERLRMEVERALRHGRDMSLAIFDIDRFRDVNERLGHQLGDDVLAEMGRRLAAQVGAGEFAARIGGEKFAVILPEVGGLDAWRTIDALRIAITARAFDRAGSLTVSAGVCDLSYAATAEEVFRLCDGALYWAKAHGRDVTFLYSPDVVHELSAAERAEGLQRAQAVAGLQGLARAVDAKDPSTRLHSERVADTAAAVAKELGWSDARCRDLHEAGLLHDVGKIGIPDSVLFKPGRLTAEEYEIVKKHAPLGAEIVTDILTEEQTSWVRHHHERVDGGGYPDALAGDAVPDGARILATVDSYDVMTNVRIYSDARGQEAALAELSRCSGSQFDPDVAAALIRVVAKRDVSHPEVTR